MFGSRSSTNTPMKKKEGGTLGATPSKRSKAVLGASGLVMSAQATSSLGKALSPMTPAKVRARRQSERASQEPSCSARQSLASVAGESHDEENIAPNRNEAAMASRLSFGWKKTPCVASTPINQGQECARKSPLNNKDELRPSPPGSNKILFDGFDAETLMKMSPMRHLSPSDSQKVVRRIVVPSPDKRSAELEQQLFALQAEERALESVHIQLKATISKSLVDSAAGISIEDIYKKEEEGMRNRFKKLETDQAALRAELTQRTRDQAGMREECDTLANELAQVSSAKASIEEAVRHKDMEIASLREEDAKLHNEIEARNTEVQSASAREAALQASLNDSKASASELAASLSVSQQELDDVRSNLASLQERHDNLNSELASAKEHHERAVQDAAAVEKSSSELQVSLAGANARVSELETSMEAAQWKAQAEADKLTQDIEELQAQLSLARESAGQREASLNAAMEEATREAAQLKQSLIKAEEVKLSLERDIAEHEAEVTRARDAAAASEAKVCALESCVEAAAREAASYKQDAEAKLEAATTQSRVHESRIEELQADMHGLQAALASARELASNLELAASSSNEEKDVQVAALRESLAAAQAQVLELQAQLQEGVQGAEAQALKMKEAAEEIRLQGEQREADMQVTIDQLRAQASQMAEEAGVREAGLQTMIDELRMQVCKASEEATQREADLQASMDDMRKASAEATQREAELQASMDDMRKASAEATQREADLQTALDEVRTRLDQATEDATLREEELQGSIHEVKLQLESAEARESILLNAVEEARGEACGLRVALKQVSEDACALQEKREHELHEAACVVKASEDVQAENNALRTSRDAMQAHVESLIGSMQAAKAKIESLEKDVASRVQEVACSIGDVSRLEGEKDRLLVQMEELQAQICIVQAERDGLNEQMRQLCMELEDTQRERDLWRGQAQSSEQQIQSLQNDMDAVNEHTRMAQDLLDSCKRESEHSKATLMNELAKAEERLEMEQKGFYESETRHQVQFQMLSQQLQQAQEQLMAQNRDLESRARQTETLVDGLAKMEKLHMQYQEAAETLKKDRATADAAVEVHVAEVEQLKRKLSSCQHAEAMAAARDAEYRATIAQNTATKASLEARIKELTMSLSSKEHDLRIIESDKDAANTTLETTRVTLTCVQERISIMEEEARLRADSMTQATQIAKDETENLRRALQTATSENRTLEEKNKKILQEAEDEQARLSQELKALEEKRDEFQAAAQLLGEEVDQLRNTLEASKRAADLAVKELQEELRCTLEALEVSRREVAHVRRISSELHCTESVLSAMQEQIDRHQHNLTASQTLMRELTRQNQELVDKAHREQAAWVRREATLCEKLEASVKDHTDLLAEHTDMIATCALLKDALDIEKITTAQLQEEAAMRERVWSASFEELKGWSHNRVNDLHSSTGSAHGYMQELSTELDSLASSFFAEAERYRAHIETLKERLGVSEQQAKEDRDAASKELAELRESYEGASRDLQESSAGLRIELESKSALLNQSLEEAASWKDRCTQAEAQSQRLRNEAQDKTKELAESGDEREQLFARIAAAEDACTKALEQAKANDQTVRDLLHKNRQLEGEKAMCMREIETLEKQVSVALDSMQALIDSKDREVSQLREELDKCTRASQDALKNETESLSKQFHARMDAEAGKAQTLERRLNEDTARAEALEARCARLADLLDVAAETVCAEQERCSELEKQNDNAAKYTFEAAALITGISAQRATLCATLKKVCDELVRSKVRHNERQAKERSLFLVQLNTAHTKLAEAEAHIHVNKSQFEERIVAVQKSCEQAESKAMLMKDELQSVAAACANAEAKVFELTEQLRLASQWRSSMENELEKVQHELVQKDSTESSMSHLQERFNALLSSLDVSPGATPSKGVAKVHVMRAEIETVRQQLVAKDVAIQELRSDLESELISKQELMASLKQDFAQLKVQVSERQGLLVEERTRNVALTNEKEEAVRHSAALQKKLGELNNHIVELEVKLAQFEEKEKSSLACEQSKVDNTEKALKNSLQQVTSLQGELDSLMQKCEEKDLEKQRLESSLEQLKEMCMQQEYSVWEQQVDAERVEDERAALEKQRDALQDYYQSACRELLRDSTSTSRSRADTLLSTSDYQGSSTPQDIHMPTNAPKRAEQTKSRIGDAGNVIACKQYALDQLTKEKGELEMLVGALETALDEERSKCASLEEQLLSMSEMVEEGRRMALEERDRMLEEMTAEKHRLMQAFTEMLRREGSDDNATDAVGLEQGKLTFEAVASVHPYKETVERDVRECPSESGSGSGMWEDAQEASGLEWSVLSARAEGGAEGLKIRAVMILLGKDGGISADSARRLLEHSGWDTTEAVKLARDASSAILRGLNRTCQDPEGEMCIGRGDVSGISSIARFSEGEHQEWGGLHTVPCVDHAASLDDPSRYPDMHAHRPGGFSFSSVFQKPYSASAAAAAAESMHSDALSFCSAYGPDGVPSLRKEVSDDVEAERDMGAFYADAALQAAMDSPVKSALAGASPRISLDSAYGRLSSSQSPETSVRERLSGPRFLF